MNDLMTDMSNYGLQTQDKACDESGSQNQWPVEADTTQKNISVRRPERPIAPATFVPSVFDPQAPIQQTGAQATSPAAIIILGTPVATLQGSSLQQVPTQKGAVPATFVPATFVPGGLALPTRTPEVRASVNILPSTILPNTEQLSSGQKRSLVTESLERSEKRSRESSSLTSTCSGPQLGQAPVLIGNCNCGQPKYRSFGQLMGECKECRALWCLVTGCGREFGNSQKDKGYLSVHLTKVHFEKGNPNVCFHCGAPKQRLSFSKGRCDVCQAYWCLHKGCNYESQSATILSNHQSKCVK